MPLGHLARLFEEHLGGDGEELGGVRSAVVVEQRARAAIGRLGQRLELAALDPTGDVVTFQKSCLALSRSVVAGQFAWDFFRDKLELRRSTYKEQLWTADTVAWDCHRPVLQAAADAGVLGQDEMREPPLVYLGTGYSPLTWVRRSRPNDGRRYDLGESTVPIPVIEIPWDHLGNGWELMSLHHEVGHDIEADLGLRKPLQTALAAKLQGGGVPAARVSTWLAWQGEVFADLCALQLGGPAFTEALMHLLLLPPVDVTTLDENDPHPTPWIRILINTGYLGSMLPAHAPLVTHATEMADSWKALYGTPTGFEGYLYDCPLVCEALMDTSLQELKGRTVRSFMPYTVADDLRVREAAGYFATGQNKPVGLPPRHCVAAGRLAVKALAAAGAVSSAAYDSVQKRIISMVKQGAAPGVRGTKSDEHDRFVAGFVKGMLE